MSGGGRPVFSFSVTRVGPDGRMTSSSFSNGRDMDDVMESGFEPGPPFMFGGGHPGGGPMPHLFHLLSPGIVPTNPFAAMLQSALQGGAIGPFGGDEEAFDHELQRLFAAHQPTAQPTAQSAIDKLPEVPITQKDVDDKTTCSVCMDEFKMEEKATKLPCEHMYHKGCVMPWLKQNHTCPVCRHELETEDTSTAQSVPAATSANNNGTSREESAPAGFGYGPFSFLSEMFGPAQPAPRPRSRSRGASFGRSQSRYEDAGGEDDELAAAIEASLHESEASDVRPREDLPRREQPSEPVPDDEMRALMLESIRSLTLTDLQTQCVTEGLHVARGKENDREHLIQLLAEKYGIADPSAVTSSLSTSSLATFATRVIVPPEPSALDPHAYMLRLRFPDGSSSTRRFSNSDTVAQVAAFALSTKHSILPTGADGTPLIRIRESAPGVTERPTFTPSNWEVRLSESGFSQRAQLIVEKL